MNGVLRRLIVYFLGVALPASLARAEAVKFYDRSGRVMEAGKAPASLLVGGLAPEMREIFLTIDLRIQAIAVQAFAPIEAGAVVVVDPATGDILALVSKSRGSAICQYALSAYAPGAAFLPVTALAGAMTGHGGDRLICDGGVTFGTRYMKCWIAARGGKHGPMTVDEALKVSCGPFFFQLGNLAGDESIRQVGELLGLGERSGLGLEDESAGNLPSQEWLRNSGLRDQWSPGHTANLSIGQGYVLATPLQMAMVAATLANGGKSYRPRLISRTRDEWGTTQETPAVIRGNLREEGIGASDFETIRRGLWKTVNEDGSSGSRTRIPGVEVAGRTGTAQVYRDGVKSNVCWFWAFAPYESPSLAICVLVDGQKAAGLVAAPVVAEVLAKGLLLGKE